MSKYNVMDKDELIEVIQGLESALDAIRGMVDSGHPAETLALCISIANLQLDRIKTLLSHKGIDNDDAV